jgi:hypothetical protein
MGIIDSRLTLALMAKADLVFSQPGQLLVFPLAGASYKPEQLNFFPADASAGAQKAALTALYDFSNYTNIIPVDRVWISPGDRSSLSDVYRRILETSDVAKLPEDPNYLDQRKTAQSLLITRSNDQSYQDTEMYTAYKARRDAYYLAVQQYNSAKISGENGNEHAAAVWATSEPVLRAVRDEALMIWQVSGYKAQVEDAFATISTLSKKTPVTAWSEWELRSREGIGTLTDLTGGAFWPTYISPANATQTGWQKMVLSREEVQTLHKNAPAQMKARLGSELGGLDVEQLEFEYTTAKLHRTWFDHDVFSSKFWRPHGMTPMSISTGSEPFSGDCPLYASSVVFFRRVRAKVNEDIDIIESKLDGLSDRIDWGLFDVSRQSLKLQERRPRVPPNQHRENLPTQSIFDLIEKTIGIASLGAKGRRISQQFRKEDTLPIEPSQKFDTQELLRRRVFKRDFNLKAPSLQIPQLADCSMISTADEEIFILAFICTVVPLSPDPDAKLNWS